MESHGFKVTKLPRRSLPDMSTYSSETNLSDVHRDMANMSLQNVYSKQEDRYRYSENAVKKHKYVKNLDIEEFLSVIPDPFKYFIENNRNGKECYEMAMPYLRGRYRSLRRTDILKCYQHNRYNLTCTCLELDLWPFKGKPSTLSSIEAAVKPSIFFLQEVAFIENMKKIEVHLNSAKYEKDMLKPAVLSSMQSYKQQMKLLATDIVRLENCPSCKCKAIPDLEDNILYCQNPDCLMVSCRACRKLNHLPQHCEQLDLDVDIMMC